MSDSFSRQHYTEDMKEKRPFMSEYAAEKEAKRVGRIIHKKMHFYKCRKCGHYHLTKGKKSYVPNSCVAFIALSDTEFKIYASDDIFTLLDKFTEGYIEIFNIPDMRQHEIRDRFMGKNPKSILNELRLAFKSVYKEGTFGEKPIKRLPRKQKLKLYGRKHTRNI